MVLKSGVFSCFFWLIFPEYYVRWPFITSNGRLLHYACKKCYCAVCLQQ